MSERSQDESITKAFLLALAMAVLIGSGGLFLIDLSANHQEQALAQAGQSFASLPVVGKVTRITLEEFGGMGYPAPININRYVYHAGGYRIVLNLDPQVFLFTGTEIRYDRDNKQARIFCFLKQGAPRCFYGKILESFEGKSLHKNKG